MDDVPTGQPALALTQKVYQRVRAAGMPADLIPEGLVSIGESHGGDAENVLRTATLEFMDTVRAVEQAIAATRRGSDTAAALDDSSLGVITEDEWRAHWPTYEVASVEEPADEPAAEESR